MSRVRIWLVGIAVFCVLTINSISDARVVDGGVAKDNLLRSITDVLDRSGIDVRNGRPIERVYTSTRPQLTRLSNFPADATIAGRTSPFVESFTAGAVSDRAFLVAVNSPGTAVPNEHVRFQALWDKTPRHKRVFISFSGADLSHAQMVSAALSTKGYIAFLYKNSSSSLPAVNAVETGQFFESAGRRYVIDTGNARSSPAVNAEALALQKSSSILPPIVDKKPNPPAAISSVPCCRVCYYRKNSLIRCDPLKCGVLECKDAR